HYTDWARWFSPRPRADITTPKNQFLTTFQGISTDGTTAQPEDVTTATLNDVYYKPVTIPGDVNDGFSYFTAGGYSYVGILESTNLGAPVQEVDGTAIWHGQLNFRNATGNFAHEFAININYGTDGGTIDGFFSNIENTPKVLFAPSLVSTANMTDFALNGDFNEYGVITGTTNFAQYTGDSVGGEVIGTEQAGLLSGIIGQEGAVGVFHGLSQNTYVGGFAVHPKVVNIVDVNYPDWIRGQTYRTIANQSSQFLQTENGMINIGLVNNDDMTVELTFETPAHYLNLNNFLFDGVAFDGDENDGLVYFVANSYAIVGILDSTNLGAPLEQTEGIVLWSGRLDFITRSGTVALDTLKAEPIKRDFVLAITFNGNGGTIEGNVEDLLFNEEESVFSIDGTFNSQGLINSGRTFFSTTNLHNGKITGLIGQEGAVGLFSGGIYAGGFVVHPDVVGRVSYSDWTDANSFSDTTSGVNEVEFLDTPFPGNHFLSTTNDVISVGTDSATDYLITDRVRGQEGFRRVTVVTPLIPNYVRFDTASHNIEPLRASDAIGGFAYFTGYQTYTNDSGTRQDDSTPRSYGGILDSTDLGPALTQGAGTAMWKGQLSYSDNDPNVNGGLAGIYRQNNDFTLIIEFNATGGKVSGFAANINSSVPGTIVKDKEVLPGLDIYLEGTFDKNGVISGNCQ
ncbi:MAG: hypothetical protein K8953_10125, partial [Proteobacteria bacterium]|nr:hypothetical protein [Pseudomonadota bacterium]